MSLCLFPFSPAALEKARTGQGYFTLVFTEIDLLVSLLPRPVPPGVSCLNEISSTHFHTQDGPDLQLSLFPYPPPPVKQSIDQSVTKFCLFHPLKASLFICLPTHSSTHLPTHFSLALSCFPHSDCQHLSPPGDCKSSLTAQGPLLHSPAHCPTFSPIRS